ncbi:MAG TPA: protein phosphatase 2C domain-containing protein [Actinomycetota bacterium]|nr:protein phosphatase 2C domain-containing protein [Actinomycetota bacterium]
MTPALVCPSCGDPVAEGDEFCETCGTRLHAPPPEEGTCPKCGARADQADPDGYCGRCGYRLARPNDHVEVEAGTMALVTDKGLRHHRNEDAGVLRAGTGFSVLVVCDGVSTTANPDQASEAAAGAFADLVEASLSGHDPSPEDAAAALVEAVAAAQKAVLGVPQEEPGGYPQAPSSTLAAAVIIGEEMVTTNVGDSRAYWIDATDAGGSRQLSKDDSMAEAAIAAGESPETAYARRDAHTITHWLGADAPEATPRTQASLAAGPGFLLVCSDGLWNYYESPESLRELILAGSAGVNGETTLETARRLVEAAIAAGGHDNITVALTALGPQAAPVPAPAPAPEEAPAPKEAPAPEVPPGEAPAPEEAPAPKGIPAPSGKETLPGEAAVEAPPETPAGVTAEAAAVQPIPEPSEPSTDPRPQPSETETKE